MQDQIQTLVTELSNRGAHIGYSRSRRHPSVIPHLYGMKNRLDIIDLEDASKTMIEARNFIQSVRASGKPIIVVGTKAEARDLVRKISERNNLLYIEQRWVGGTITNLPQIKKRIDTMNTLKEQQATNTLLYRTKKEKLMLERKLAKLEITFGGLQGYVGAPGAVVVIDPKVEHNCIHECTLKKIPVIALGNTDSDINGLDFPIVANDASLGTIQYVLEYLLSE